jgi:monovalent cation/hydrogen antiporter
VAEYFELIVFGLLVAVAGLVLLSDVLEVPYPIFLVLGGLVLGFIPGVPEKLAPELVLLRGLPAGRGIEHFGYTRVRDPGSGDSG